MVDFTRSSPGRPKGYPKTGGRKKGTPNKLTRSLKEAILGALDQAGGQAYLAKVARDDPRTFCSLLARILPSEIKADVAAATSPSQEEWVVLLERMAGSPSTSTPSGHTYGANPAAEL